MTQKSIYFRWITSAILVLTLLSTQLSAQNEATAVANRILMNLMKAWNDHDGRHTPQSFGPTPSSSTSSA